MVKTNVVFTVEVIDATAVVLSDAIRIDRNSVFSVWAKADATGTPDLVIDYLLSWRQDQDFVAPETGDSLTLSDKLAHVDAVVLPISMYMIIRVTGGGSNPADTVLDLVLQMS